MDAKTPKALVVTGRINRADVPGLCARLEALLGSGVPEVTAVDCDVSGVVYPDLALVEAVARLGLVARRTGGVELRLRNVPPEVRVLLELTGLADVIGPVRTAPGQERDPVRSGPLRRPVSGTRRRSRHESMGRSPGLGAVRSRGRPCGG
ncbi:STAS domain-containing protein [Streptomyces sp. M10(2022)]